VAPSAGIGGERPLAGNPESQVAISSEEP
jgi:hypothetical protein